MLAQFHMSNGLFDCQFGNIAGFGNFSSRFACVFAQVRFKSVRARNCCSRLISQLHLLAALLSTQHSASPKRESDLLVGFGNRELIKHRTVSAYLSYMHTCLLDVAAGKTMLAKEFGRERLPARWFSGYRLSGETGAATTCDDVNDALRTILFFAVKFAI
jgi:hypothetical protein